MKLIRFLVRQSPAVLVSAIVTGAFSGTLSALFVALLNAKLGQPADAAGLMAWAFVGVTVSVLLSNLTSRLLLLRLSTQAVLTTRMRLCRQLLDAPLARLESHGAPKMLATLTDDVLAVSDTLAELPILGINIAIIVAGVAYMAWMSWPLALAFALAFAVGVVTYELIERRTRPHLVKGRERWDQLIAAYQALIWGNKELKLHRERREAFFSASIHASANAMRELSLKWHNLFALAAAYGQAYYFVLIGSVLFLAPVFGVTDVGVLTGFTLTILFINGPISSILAMLPSFQRAAVALQKIESLGLSLAEPEAKTVVAEPWLREELSAGIQVEQVVYTYTPVGEDKPFTLGPVDLQIRPGELLFITGGNGSGKSSFARLLTGLYAPDSGVLRWNGHDITDATRDGYRQNFSVVFADYFLFDTLFGLVTEDDRERVQCYLEKLQLTRKVTVHEGRFSTLNLSQGQRKRLALLTAFMEDRPIYLFDEWAADQDPVFKEVFYLQILPELKARHKTVIVISHDDHYYYGADRLVKFEDGLLVEDRAVRPPRPNVHLVET